VDNEGRAKFSFGGTPVDMKHENFNQFLAIITGIKTTIENLSTFDLSNHNVCADDFITNHEVTLSV